MPNKYDKEIEEDQHLRDILILERITSIYKDIRKKAQEQSKSVIDKAAKDQAYFNQGTRLSDFETEFSQAVRPDYVKRDAFSKKVYSEEYATSYFQAKYAVENQGITKGFDFKLPTYTDKQFQEARDYALSKLMNKSKMSAGRNLNIAQLEDIIVSGVQQGLSLKNINKNLDIAIGFRDDAGKWVDDAVERKRQFAQTQKILRTEISRMRGIAEKDEWVNQQSVVESEFRIHAVRDSRTRKQSYEVDGELSNKEGKFLYPDGNHYFKGMTGNPAWDIYDREYLTQEDPIYPPSTVIERDPKKERMWDEATAKERKPIIENGNKIYRNNKGERIYPRSQQNEIVPYRSANDYRKAHNLTINKYGEWLD
ncbi:MAG: hypothetical protein GY928_21220 [Colwellia sp.]|nr:hypothetical protein [Colwellia sp.]